MKSQRIPDGFASLETFFCPSVSPFKHLQEATTQNTFVTKVTKWTFSKKQIAVAKQTLSSQLKPL